MTNLNPFIEARVEFLESRVEDLDSDIDAIVKKSAQNQNKVEATPTLDTDGLVSTISGLRDENDDLRKYTLNSERTISGLMNYNEKYKSTISNLKRDLESYKSITSGLKLDLEIAGKKEEKLNVKLFEKHTAIRILNEKLSFYEKMCARVRGVLNDIRR